MASIVIDYLDITKEKYPDKTAFIDKKREITFRGLYDEAVSIAGTIAECGLFGSPVLIFMEKSISMISCFAGVAYSGNYYSPADIKMPGERIEKILKTLDPAVIITDSENEDAARAVAGERKILVYEELVKERPAYDRVMEIRGKIRGTDLLYVMFTSGSTGMPKGVMIDHRAVIDFTDWISGCYHFDENTVFGNQAQLYFDLSLQDVYAPLRNGSTTVLIPNRLYASPVRVWDMILKNKVNTLVWIPSMLSLFAYLDIPAHTQKAPLKTVLFCGEVMPVRHLNHWISHYPETVFGNMYGPTECTEACTYYTVDRKFEDGDVLPIGKPCDNTEAILISEDGKVLTKQGETGELCIGGVCLSHGYYGDSKATDEAFIPNPDKDSENKVIYRTGDLAFYNESGELVYAGRMDTQIKIRGYRVELGEIESMACAAEGVAYCCCLYDREDSRLILVYEGDADETEVERSLKDKLQDYMIPAEYIRREKMLFNDNGKVDRKALNREYLEK